MNFNSLIIQLNVEIVHIFLYIGQKRTLQLFIAPCPVFIHNILMNNPNRNGSSHAIAGLKARYTVIGFVL